MRIGLYIPFLDPKPSGVGVYIEEIVRRLIAMHPDCAVYTAEPKRRPAWLDRAPTYPCRLPHSPSRTMSLGVIRRAERLTWLSVYASKELLQNKVDVLFSPVQEGLLVDKPPQVVVAHDLTALRYPDAFNKLHVMQTRWIFPRVLKTARKVIAVSEHTKRDLVELFKLKPETIEVIPEGFDPTVFAPASEEECARVARLYGLPSNYLLYTGTFSRHKNLPLALRALSLVKEDRELALVLVGRQGARAAKELEELSKRLGVYDRVRHLGYVPREDLPGLMSGCTAFVYPSLYEGFGLAPLEAMACGAPVLAANVASLPEVVGDAGVLLPPDSPGAWADALSGLLRPSQRQPLKERSLARAARFSWDDAARQVLEVLRAAV